MCLQILMNIHHYVFKIIEKKVSRVDGRTDGRTDGVADGQCENNIPHLKEIGFATQFECQNRI